MLIWEASFSPLCSVASRSRRIRSESYLTVLVIGQGSIGIILAALARRTGATVLTSDLYAERHQAAADMKASGSLSSGEISAALGHVSDVTKSTYGHANMGRKSGGVAPSQVEAARPVQTKAPSKAAAKRVAKDNPAALSDESNSMGMSM